MVLMNWPETIALLGILAFIAFVFWMAFRD
jgi:hypothetical protein